MSVRRLPRKRRRVRAFRPAVEVQREIETARYARERAARQSRNRKA